MYEGLKVQPQKDFYLGTSIALISSQPRRCKRGVQMSCLKRHSHLLLRLFSHSSKKTLLCGQFLRLSEPSSSLFWTLNRLTPHFHNFFESLTAIITPFLLHAVGRWGLRGKLLMIRIFQVEQKSLIVRESFACQTFFNFSLLPLLKYFKLTFLALN